MEMGVEHSRRWISKCVAALICVLCQTEYDRQGNASNDDNVGPTLRWRANMNALLETGNRMRILRFAL